MYRPTSIHCLIRVYFLGCLSEDRNRSVGWWRSGVAPAIDEFLETAHVRFAVMRRRLLLVPMRSVTHWSLREANRQKSGESRPSESQDRALLAQFASFPSGPISDLRGLTAPSVIPIGRLRSQPTVDIRAGESCQRKRTLDDNRWKLSTSGTVRKIHIALSFQLVVSTLLRVEFSQQDTKHMHVSNVMKLRLTLVPLALLLASGCELMGKTSLQTVPLEEPVMLENIARVQVESVSKEAGAAREYAIGVRSGDYSFTDEDLANLQGSLESTIKSVTNLKELHPTRQVRILLMIRSYVVAYTNHSLAMLAAIDWCAEREDGLAIYREVFYAPRSWNVLGPTPGSEKDAIARAVVRRVGESSLMFAAGSEPNEVLPRSFDGTYDTFEEAVSTLPTNMRSWGLLYFPDPYVPIPIYFPGSDTVNVPWQSVDAPAAISCDAVMRDG